MPRKRERFAPPPILTAPTLLTEVGNASWSGGVMFIQSHSGPTPVALAMSPNTGLQLLQALQAGLCADPQSPLVRQEQPVSLVEKRGGQL